MQRDFGASAGDIAWMVTSYLLFASIATPIFGRLGDVFGKQRPLAISPGCFAVGAVGCALADALGVGRGLQGLGGGVFPLCFVVSATSSQRQGADRHRAARRYHATFSVGTAAVSVAFFALMGGIFALTQYLQFAHGYRAIDAGAIMSPMTLGLMLGAGSSSMLVPRAGVAWVVAGAGGPVHHAGADRPV